MADGAAAGTGKWKARWERLKAKQANEQEREHEGVAAGIDMFASYASAGLVGFLHGRKGGMPAVAKMPIDLLIGGFGSLIGFGLIMTGSSYGRHVAAFGQGAGNYWFGGQMAKIGQDKRQKAGEMLSQYDDKGNLLSVRTMTDAEATKAGVQLRGPITSGIPQGAPQRSAVSVAY
jgi:hypothetical protein